MDDDDALLPVEDTSPFEHHRLGLSLREGLSEDDLTYEDWEAQGVMLGAIGTAYRWWVGDWLRLGQVDGDGEGKWQLTYEWASLLTGLDEDSLYNCKWLAGKYDVSRRREEVSWSHHEAVAALPEPEQDEWLERAEDQDWSCRTLRHAVRDAYRTGDDGQERTVHRDLGDPAWQGNVTVIGNGGVIYKDLMPPEPGEYWLVAYRKE